MRRVGSRRQRTIKKPAEVTGIGFITAATIRLKFLPAPDNHGIAFRRVDLPGHPLIPAHVSRVIGTKRRTTIGDAQVQVCLVEHVMAALAGLRIDNCTVEIDAAEPPGMDGSALAFTEALLDAGVIHQAAIRPIYTVTAPCGIRMDQASITLHPSQEPELRATYFLDYGLDAPLPRQNYTVDVHPAAFEREIAPCRTFILESEMAMLRSQGLGAKTTPKDLVIFGPKGPIDNSLRFANEAARHKVLDILGDLALLGVDLAGHVVACRSGHPLNVALGQDLWTRCNEYGVGTFRPRFGASESGESMRRAA